jgi:Ni,Fe-hydrogenase I large subunit
MFGESAGVLHARVRCRGAEIDAVELQLRRPLELLTGLHGKSPDECLRLLPLLFPLCGMAHALAALQAIEASLGIEPDPAHLAARATLALADATAAHVWRTCIDWPQLAGEPVFASPVARARRLSERIAVALYPDGDWRRLGGGRLAPDAAALARACAELEQLRAETAPAVALSVLRQQLTSALAGAEGEWQARLDACFADMADATTASFERLDARLRMAPTRSETPVSSAPFADSGDGSGSVDTARGVLCYQIRIASRKVENCTLVAPTDRTFDGSGPVAPVLHRLQRADQPVLAVRWILAAFDPCIEVQVEAVAAG